jgi:hypothetical protein
MIWLTWRQFRAQTIVTSALLAVLAVVLAITGLHLAALYDNSGLGACTAHGDCVRLATTFLGQAKADTVITAVYDVGVVVLYAAPALIGVFWGAPLLTREIEAGTFRLAWSQSVTRTRWLAVKLGLIAAAAIATAGLLSLIISWWAAPVDRAAPLASAFGRYSAQLRIAPLLFGARGIVPLGYAAFAFALGVTAGLLIRRTVPAMAVTLAAFAAAEVAMAQWVRPHLITPVRAIVPLNVGTLQGLLISNNSKMIVQGAVNKPGAWILSNQTIDPAGHVFTGPPTTACVSQTNSFQACQASVSRLHLRQLVTYQPASRFWALQGYETAIFLTAALALAGLCFWWVSRRRLS